MCSEYELAKKCMFNEVYLLWLLPLFSAGILFLHLTFISCSFGIPSLSHSESSLVCTSKPESNLIQVVSLHWSGDSM